MVKVKINNKDIDESYDFSNDCKIEKYININNKIEKYFTYKTVINKIKNICLYDEYKGLIDPDSNSKLLQEIYMYLYDVDIIKLCGKEKRIQGDTMNSVQTTLNKTWKKEILNNENSRISLRRMVNLYINDKEKIEEKLRKITRLEEFMSIYHTLGNFIPIPHNRRGLNDYWDLTLKAIYDYYINNDSTGLDKLAGKDKTKDYIEWLNLFKDKDNKTSWKNFIERNYMEAFIHKNYGEPRELWKEHFQNKGKLPKKGQYEKFYTNASTWIEKRSKKMLKVLPKKIEDMIQKVYDIVTKIPEGEVTTYLELAEKLGDKKLEIVVEKIINNYINKKDIHCKIK